MRIAQISPYDLSYHGGVVAHMASLSKYLAKRGHEVVLFAPRSRPQTAPDVSGLEVVPLGGSVPFNASGSVSRISMSLKAALQMRRILNSERFDVVHIHEPLMPFLGTTASLYSPVAHCRNIPRLQREHTPRIPLIQTIVLHGR